MTLRAVSPEVGAKFAAVCVATFGDDVVAAVLAALSSPDVCRHRAVMLDPVGAPLLAVLALLPADLFRLAFAQGLLEAFVGAVLDLVLVVLELAVAPGAPLDADHRTAAMLAAAVTAGRVLLISCLRYVADAAVVADFRLSGGVALRSLLGSTL